MARKTYPSDVIREQCERIQPILESARRQTKPRTLDLYEVFCAVLSVLRSGWKFLMLPEGFPKWRSVHAYSQIWSQERDGQPTIYVTTANVTERTGAVAMVMKEQGNLVQVERVLVDASYIGKPFAEAIQAIIGAAAIQATIGAAVEVVKRSELHTFKLMPKRWVVERSFSWLEKDRRLWKNCEQTLTSSLQMMVLGHHPECWFSRICRAQQ